MVQEIKEESNEIYEQSLWIDNSPCIKHVTKNDVKTYPVSLGFKELNVAMNSLATKLINDNKIAEAFTPVKTQATHTFLLTLLRFLTSSLQ